jgi:hypothetical protein
MSLDLLHELYCTDDQARWTDDLWPIAIGGEPHVVGTDGRLAVAVRTNKGVAESKYERNTEALETLASMFGEASGGVELSRDALIAWCDVDLAAPKCEKCDGVGRHKCSRCQGKRVRTRWCDDCGDQHKCECRDCGTDGTVECWRCDGKGRDQRPPAKIGRLFGVLVDRRLLRRVLAMAPESFRCVAPKPENFAAPFTFYATGWRAVLMPMRDDDDSRTQEMPTYGEAVAA